MSDSFVVGCVDLSAVGWRLTHSVGSGAGRALDAYGTLGSRCLPGSVSGGRLIES